MSLKQIKFRLPHWQQAQLDTFGHMREQLGSLIANHGQTSDGYKQAEGTLLSLAKKKNVKKETVLSCLDNSLSVRALFTLWTSPAFRQSIPFCRDLLEGCMGASNQFGSVTRITAIRLFFQVYDQLGDDYLFLGAEIIRQLKMRKTSKHSDYAQLLGKDFFLFNKDAPVQMMQRCIEKGTELHEELRDMGLRGHETGRFYCVCQGAYFLDQINSIEVGEHHPTLDILKRKEIHTVPYGSDGELLGHAVIKLMIDRSSGHAISAAWKNTIGAIAGDPRIPEGGNTFRQWWQPIGAKRVEIYRAWLSRIDLEAFLKIIGEFADSGKNKSLKKMFPARKALLEGLFNLGLVEEARLFLGRRPIQFLEKNYSQNDLPAFCHLNDASRSVIYLNLGRCHIFEGSHSAKCWVFPYLPNKTSFMGDKNQLYQYSELSTDIKFAIDDQNKRHVTALTHNNKNFSWQAKIIGVLRTYGFNPDVSKLMTADDYHAFKKIRSDVL